MCKWNAPDPVTAVRVYYLDASDHYVEKSHVYESAAGVAKFGYHEVEVRPRGIVSTEQAEQVARSILAQLTSD